MTWRFSAGFLALSVALVFLAACNDDEAEVEQPETTTVAARPAASPSNASGVTVWRWVNVTLLVPNDGRFDVIQDSDPAEARPPEGGPVLRLETDPSDNPLRVPSSSVRIDAETGEILREEIAADDRAAIQAVLDTLTVAPLDVSTAKWPYNGEPPADQPRETFGGVSFIRPTPDTGLLVGGAIGDPGGPGLTISNGRSGLGVDIDESTGELRVDTQYLLPEDQPFFMQWVDSVKLCGSEVSC